LGRFNPKTKLKQFAVHLGIGAIVFVLVCAIGGCAGFFSRDFYRAVGLETFAYNSGICNRLSREDFRSYISTVDMGTKVYTIPNSEGKKPTKGKVQRILDIGRELASEDEEDDLAEAYSFLPGEENCSTSRYHVMVEVAGRIDPCLLEVVRAPRSMEGDLEECAAGGDKWFSRGFVTCSRIQSCEMIVHEERDRSLGMEFPRISPQMMVGKGDGKSFLVLKQRNDMGSAFKLLRAYFAIDGRPLSVTGQVIDLLPNETGAPAIVYSGPVASGYHLISVVLEYQGQGAFFSYVEGYKFRIKASYEAVVEEEKTTTVEVISYEKGNITTELLDRPAIRFTEASKQANSVAAPVEKKEESPQPKKSDSEEPQSEVAEVDPNAEEKLALNNVGVRPQLEKLLHRSARSLLNAYVYSEDESAPALFRNLFPVPALELGEGVGENIGDFIHWLDLNSYQRVQNAIDLRFGDIMIDFHFDQRATLEREMGYLVEGDLALKEAAGADSIGIYLGRGLIAIQPGGSCGMNIVPMTEGYTAAYRVVPGYVATEYRLPIDMLYEFTKLCSPEIAFARPVEEIITRSATPEE